MLALDRDVRRSMGGRVEAFDIEPRFVCKSGGKRGAGVRRTPWMGSGWLRCSVGNNGREPIRPASRYNFLDAQASMPNDSDRFEGRRWRSRFLEMVEK